ncbi:hypothetical protein HYU23_03045 [Candidatus Woesearchaeota archaeon]|nr:hypothetical protein [Candidatus Woesearchaeota archaeon]
MITSKGFITFKDLRKEFPSTIANNTIQSFIYKINSSIKELYPNVEIFSLEIVQNGENTIKIYKLKENIIFTSTKNHGVLLLENEKE